MSDVKAELSRIHEAIRAADESLIDALDARADAVRTFVALREREPEGYHALPPTTDAVRQLLERARAFPNRPLERVLREVFGACQAMVAPIKVAVPGPEGGFAHLAAFRHFGSSTEIEAHDEIAEVFQEVERQRVSFGVVPFESSSEGAMAQTLDALIASDARVAGELTVASAYDLVSGTGNVADVEKVYATGAALAACEKTLRREMPRATILDVRSALVGAALAAEDHGAAAVIARGTDLRDQGLRNVREHVEDQVGVEVRFVVIGHEPPPRTGEDRTILSLVVRDGPGGLYDALRPFADRGINLTRVESRAVRGGDWRYVFVLELEGHVTDRPVLTALDEVRASSRHLKVLGSYPR